ncbi:MAG: hypothetical protein MRJ93_05250 [Nitrososphaeraceae archaeon]|nr:hypothetical protein [Nitrososphaeraceae archaeon]
MIHYQALNFASKGFGVDYLKEIFESIPPRTIQTASAVQQPRTKSKVRVRTASTDEYNTTNNGFNNRATNERLSNSYLGNNNLYDDYMA